MTTWEEYLRLFEDVKPEHQIIGEASVHYLCSELALSKIYQYNPDAKIITIISNPVYLVYSYHSQLLYNVGEEDEPDFEKAWHLQDLRKQGQSIPTLSRNPATLQYKNIGSLGTQIEKLLGIFPAKQVKVIVFEDLKASTKSVYEEVLAFLELFSDRKNNFPQINKNRKHRISLLGRLTEKPPKILVKKVDKFKRFFRIESLGIIDLIRNINREEFERPPLNSEFRDFLVDEFRTEINKLSNTLNVDLSHWLK